MANELELLRYVCTDRGLRTWLESERDRARKVLLEALEPNLLFRAQGELRQIERQINLLDKSK
jgi:hypothetical protein